MTADPLGPLAKAARGDRTLVVRGLTDPGSMIDIIWPAFRDEVAPWATLDYAQDVVARRLLGAIGAAEPGDRPTVVAVSSPILFDRAGLAERLETPWADRFPAGWLDPAGRWLPLYVQPIVAIYNAHRVAPPGSWSDLADPGLRGRISIDDPARMLTTGPALAELTSVLAPDAWTNLVRGLQELEPRLVGDNERAVLDVSTGSAWVGLSNWNVARRVRPGSPVRHTFLRPTPCVPGFGVLIKGSPGIALGRLFLTWLSSPNGQRAYAATGRIPAQPDIDAVPSLSAVLPAGVEALFGTADWLTEPERWAERFRELMPADRATVREGKLH